MPCDQLDVFIQEHLGKYLVHFLVLYYSIHMVVNIYLKIFQNFLHTYLFIM